MAFGEISALDAGGGLVHGLSTRPNNSKEGY